MYIRGFLFYLLSPLRTKALWNLLLNKIRVVRSFFHYGEKLIKRDRRKSVIVYSDIPRFADRFKSTVRMPVAVPGIEMRFRPNPKGIMTKSNCYPFMFNGHHRRNNREPAGIFIIEIVVCPFNQDDFSIQALPILQDHFRSMGLCKIAKVINGIAS